MERERGAEGKGTEVRGSFLYPQLRLRLLAVAGTEVAAKTGTLWREREARETVVPPRVNTTIALART